MLVAISNGLVAVFNLLPGLPLDGGRVLKALLWRLSGDQHRATVWSAQAGRAVGLVVVPLVLLVALPAAGGRVTLVGAGFAALLAGRFPPGQPSRRPPLGAGIARVVLTWRVLQHRRCSNNPCNARGAQSVRQQ